MPDQDTPLPLSRMRRRGRTARRSGREAPRLASRGGATWSVPLALLAVLLTTAGLLWMRTEQDHSASERAAGLLAVLSSRLQPGELQLTPDPAALDLGELVLGSRHPLPQVFSIANNGRRPVEIRARLKGIDNAAVAVANPRLGPGQSADLEITLFGRDAGEQAGTLAVWAERGARLRREIPLTFRVTDPKPAGAAASAAEEVGP